MKPIMIVWPVILTFIAGIFQDAPFEGTVYKIDLLLREEEVAFIFPSLTNGESMLIKSAKGEVILVNTGGPSTAKQLREWLNKFRVRRIETIVITNQSEEYTANLPWLIQLYGVKTLISAAPPNKGYPLKSRNLNEGERYELLPNLTVAALSKYKDTLTLSFQYGDFRLLYMASAAKAVERKLKTIPLKDINVLKIASFAEEKLSRSFLKHTDPQAAVIFRKEGTAPNQRLLEELYHLWIEIYHLEAVRMVAIKCDSEHYEIITF